MLVESEGEDLSRFGFNWLARLSQCGVWRRNTRFTAIRTDPNLGYSWCSYWIRRRQSASSSLHLSKVIKASYQQSVMECLQICTKPGNSRNNHQRACLVRLSLDLSTSRTAKPVPQMLSNWHIRDQDRDSLSMFSPDWGEVLRQLALHFPFPPYLNIACTGTQ